MKLGHYSALFRLEVRIP